MDGGQLFSLLLKHWSAIVGLLSLIGAAGVLWLSTKFPRRKEFEERTLRLHQRVDALSERMDTHSQDVQKVLGELRLIDERIRSVDEKVGLRFKALDNQVTILLRGHMEWGE